jgi:RNA-directed DNA polymerase
MMSFSTGVKSCWMIRAPNPGALKLILEPIFEADFQPGSYGYRPNKSAHEAGGRVAKAILEGKTEVIDLDLTAYFETIRHHQVLAKVARRVDDAKVMHLLKLMLKVSGKQGVAQGSVISPLISNLYLTEVDRMLERAKAVTQIGRRTAVEYCRFADDMVVLIGHIRAESGCAKRSKPGCGRSSRSSKLR